MGAWGADIFQDDVGLDVRDEWLEHYKVTSSAAKASAATRVALKDYFKDSDDGPVAVLALALTLWRHGVLDRNSRAAAMRVIDKKQCLERWSGEGEKAVKSHLAAMAKVRNTLTSPQPTKKVYAKRKPVKADDPGLKVGEHFSLPLPDNGNGFFRVIGIEKDRSNRYPVVQLLDIDPASEPSPKQLAAAKSVGIRNYSNSSATNHRFRAEWVSGWNRKGAPKKQLRSFGVLPVAKMQLAKPGDAFTGTDWSFLAHCVRPSLDTSEWKTIEQMEALYRSLTPEQLRERIVEIEHDIRRSMHDRWSVCVPPNRLVRYGHEFARAEPIYELATRMFPDDYLTWEYLGRAYWYLGRHDDAEKAWEKAISLVPKSTELKWIQKFIADVKSGEDLKEE